MKLNAAGANPKLDVDGDLGPATLAAIKAFQTNHGLVPDGASWVLKPLPR
jgi:peptidoglycan hydrolase-like protein with peptidoglycan-binding domain